MQRKIVNFQQLRALAAAMDHAAVVHATRRRIRELDQQLAEMEEYNRRLNAALDTFDEAG